MTFYCLSDREVQGYSMGPNLIISMMDHFITNLTVLPKELIIYLDNCPSQNKNNYTMWYLHQLLIGNEYKIGITRYNR